MDRPSDHSPEQLEQLIVHTLARTPLPPMLDAECVPLGDIGITLSVTPGEFFDLGCRCPSCDKFEAEEVGGELLELANGHSEWNAVPWPKLVGYFLGNDELHVAASLGMVFDEKNRRAAFSVEEYLVNLAELPRLTVVRPEDEGCTFSIVCPGVGRFEKSRKNGIPQALALGVGVLLKLGYIQHIPREGAEPDLLAPTEALLIQAKEIAELGR